MYFKNYVYILNFVGHLEEVVPDQIWNAKRNTTIYEILLIVVMLQE